MNIIILDTYQNFFSWIQMTNAIQSTFTYLDTWILWVTYLQSFFSNMYLNFGGHFSLSLLIVLKVYSEDLMSETDEMTNILRIKASAYF